MFFPDSGQGMVPAPMPCRFQPRPPLVIPAKAGIQLRAVASKKEAVAPQHSRVLCHADARRWIPAFAGMTQGIKTAGPFAVLLFLVLLAFPAFAQTTATANEKLIGTACADGAAGRDYDTIAQCNAASGAGTFQKAPVFVGKVTSPPYATTDCDADKAGLIQWTGTSLLGCDGSSWLQLN